MYSCNQIQAMNKFTRKKGSISILTPPLLTLNVMYQARRGDRNVRDSHFTSISTCFLLDFETVHTVWYHFCYILDYG